MILSARYGEILATHDGRATVSVGEFDDAGNDLPLEDVPLINGRGTQGQECILLIIGLRAIAIA